MPDETESLRPLYRLRQLALDLQSALERDDIEIMARCAGLLAPALANCEDAAANSLTASEAVEIALAARQTLTQCEATLERAMAQIHSELRRLQQGKRASSAVRPYPAGVSGFNLDTSR